MSGAAVARAALCAVLLTTAALAGVLTSGSIPKAPYLELNDGHRLPQLGLGTWLGNSSQGRIKPQGHEVQQAVEWAIAAGYRHIDTARVYGTERQVGAAIRAAVQRGDVKREDLFVTTKLWNDRHARDAVVPALRESLAELGLEYVDLYLVHWPIGQFPNGSYDLTDHLSTWRGMEEARRLGLARSVGLSNFNQSQVEGILAGCEVKPAVLQVEMELGVAAIPKTVTKQRVEQNIDIFDFNLSAADRAALRGYDAGLRTIAGGKWADSPQYPFERSEA